MKGILRRLNICLILVLIVLNGMTLISCSTSKCEEQRKLCIQLCDELISNNFQKSAKADELADKIGHIAYVPENDLEEEIQHTALSLWLAYDEMMPKSYLSTTDRYHIIEKLRTIKRLLQNAH